MSIYARLQLPLTCSAVGLCTSRAMVYRPVEVTVGGLPGQTAGGVATTASTSTQTTVGATAGPYTSTCTHNIAHDIEQYFYHYLTLQSLKLVLNKYYHNIETISYMSNLKQNMSLKVHYIINTKYSEYLCLI